MSEVFKSLWIKQRRRNSLNEEQKNSKIHDAKEKLLWNFSHFKLPIEYHKYQTLNHNVQK